MTRRIMNLWPSRIFLEEFDAIEASEHNKELEFLVVQNATGDRTFDPYGEMRLHNMHNYNLPSVKWLIEKIQNACREYVELDAYHQIQIELRGVLFDYGSHINTHNEMAESDIGVAYWPSGNPDKIGSKFNANGDRVNEPTFVFEDPSRLISDPRLPFEHRHSVSICPRPGLLAIFPSHLRHNVHPYLSEKPFVQIVAQVRLNIAQQSRS